MIRTSLSRPQSKVPARHRLRPSLDVLEVRFLLAAGDLDTAFGTSGEVLTAFPPASKQYKGTGGNPSVVAIQSDGKIVVAGQGLHSFALARYNTDGSLDPTFGTGGKVETTFGTNHQDSIAAIAFQPDGKIIAVGGTNVLDSTTHENHFAIARYNTNGTLDTTFGPNHNGLVTTSIVANDFANSVVIQPDGKIVVAGSAGSQAPLYGSSSTVSDALVRYNADGTLDTSFGQGGIIKMSIVPGASQEFNGVALETINMGGISTTEIVASGPVVSSARGSVLARFNLNGTLDPSFGSGGTVILQTVNPVVVLSALAIQPDGKIVEAGTATSSQGVRDAAVVRFNSDGSLDTSFDPNGPMPGLVDLGVTGLADSVVLQPDGKIVVGGYGTSPILLARLNGADGSLDPTFGSNGLVLTTLPGNPTVKGLALQSDGKIVTAGLASGLPGSTDGYVAVARFLGDTPPAASLAAAAASSRNVAPNPIPLAAASKGAATFSGLTIDEVGAGHTLELTSSKMSSAVTSPIAVTSSGAIPALFATNATLAPDPLLAPLVFDSPGFLDSLGLKKRTRPI
jgi:uncharacterized delta-60 repeat protein